MSRPAERAFAFQPPLLFRQLALLAFICGICCLRLPWAGALGFLVIIVSAHRRALRLSSFALLLVCLGCGLGYAVLRAPQTLPLPKPFSATAQSASSLALEQNKALSWAREALTPQGAFYAKGLWISAVVKNVQPMPDKRLRIILDKVRPLGKQSEEVWDALTEEQQKLLRKTDALPGLLVLTWQSPDFYPLPANMEHGPGRASVTGNPAHVTIPAQTNEAGGEIPGNAPGNALGDARGNMSGDAPHDAPGNARGDGGPAIPGVSSISGGPADFKGAGISGLLPGQKIRVRLNLRPVRGLVNEGGLDTEAYWNMQGIIARAWIYGDKAPVVVEGKPKTLDAWREALRQALYRNLPRAAGQDGAAKEGSVDEAPAPAEALDKQAPEAAPEAAPETAPEAAQEVAQEGAVLSVLPQGADFLPALLLGDRFGLNSGAMDLFSLSTLAHSLALSGLHLGYAAGVGYLLGRLFHALLLPLCSFLQRPAPLRQQVEIVFALITAAFYTWLGGAPPSLLRAWLMLFFWGALLWLKRPAVLLDGLLWAVGVILLVNPLALFDLRLQLSALSICAIALAVPLIERAFAVLEWRRPWFCANFKDRALKFFASAYNRVVKGAVYLLGISLAVQVVLQPFTLAVFGNIGVSFYLNLLWLPVLGAWVMPLAFAGLALACAGLHSLAQQCFELAALPCSMLVNALQGLNDRGLLFSPVGLRPLEMAIAGFWVLLLALVLAAQQRHARNACGVAGLGACGVAGLDADAEEKPAAESTPEQISGQLAAQLPEPADMHARSATGMRAVNEPGPARQKTFSNLSVIFLLLLGFGLLYTPALLRVLEGRKDFVRLHALDVGQGQSILLEWSDNGKVRRLLLDGGGVNSPGFDTGQDVIMPLLTRNRPPDVDFIVNTHPDTDHLRGLIYPAAHLRVKVFASNGGDMQGHASGKGFAEDLERTLAASGYVFSAGLGNGGGNAEKRRELWQAPAEIELSSELKLEVLHPTPEDAALLRDNDASLVLRLVWRGQPLALLCGDIERKGLNRLLRRHAPPETGRKPDKKSGAEAAHAPFPALRAEVLVIPHHGSAGSYSPEFYDAVAPRLGLVSCGYGNRWNFPVAKVAAALQARGIPLRSTAQHGQITLEWNDPKAEGRISFARPEKR